MLVIFFLTILERLQTPKISPAPFHPFVVVVVIVVILVVVAAGGDFVTVIVFTVIL